MDKSKNGFGVVKAIGTVFAVTAIFSGLYWLYKKYYVKPTDENQVLKEAYDNLTFETGKAVINPTSFPFLNEIATILLNPKALKWLLTIEGHTDSSGSVATNNKLSLARANSVKAYLVSKGIDSTRIITNGFGSSKPIADNKTEEGKSLNRRVEFRITKP
jgi:OmpA-OmpF porin, OOP family